MKQLNMAGMVKVKQKEKEKQCSHELITVPYGWDYENDRIYYITVCRKGCGYELI